MKASSLVNLKDTGAERLLLLLVGVCVLSMTGVGISYHIAIGRIANAAADSTAAVQKELRSSYGLIESLSVTQNSLQRLLRERDPDVLETLVNELNVRQHSLSDQIDALGDAGEPVRISYGTWAGVARHIVDTFLRGENAEANSSLVNRLMPESEQVLAAVRNVNVASELAAAKRAESMDQRIERIRYRAVAGVAIAAVLVSAGGLVLRRQVVRGTGAFAEALSRLTSLRAANEALEQRVKERTAQIERSNAQMAAIHETSLDCVFVLDHEWRIMELNPAARKTFHCGDGDAIGKKLPEFVIPRGARGNKGFCTMGESSILGRLFEVSGRRSSGAEFPAEVAITAAEIDGPPIYVAALRDLTERKKAEADRQELNDRLLAASRHAGMAEVAVGVLHNVGNVLNSVNVSASVVANKLRQSEVPTLAKVGQMLREHDQDLASYLADDDQGKLIPGFIAELAQCLGDEQNAMLEELSALHEGLEHIKQIVVAQQSLAKKTAVVTDVEPSKLMEMALTMQGASLQNDEIEIVRDFKPMPDVPLDQHRIVQILVNLIGNAKHAVKAGNHRPRRIILAIEPVDAPAGRCIRFGVRDSGIGIAPQNLARIFSHGFTTKKDGHGFGLHSSANAAKEMDGTLTAVSDGPGTGATFTLEIPLVKRNTGEPCSS